MAYTITKVETSGSKFGEKGDAEVVIQFKMPNVPDEKFDFAVMLLRDEQGNTPLGLSYYIDRRDKGILMTHGCLTYRPRFAFSISEPSTWKLKTLDDLLEIIRDFSEKLESVVARTSVPLVVSKLIKNPNLDSTWMDWIPQQKVWRIHLAMRQPTGWQANERWPTLLDRTYYDQTRRIDTERELKFTEEELGQLNIEWLNNVMVEMATEVNERAMRNAAMNKLTEKLRTKELQCTDIRFMALNAHELEIWSGRVKEKRNITWLNAIDLLSQVEALDVEKLAFEMGQAEALVQAEEQRRQRLAEDADERKAEKTAEKAAKTKLEEDWATLTVKTQEMMGQQIRREKVNT